MSKTKQIEEVAALREYLNLSFWQIAKLLCNNCTREQVARKALSLYGQYKNYKKRVEENHKDKEMKYATEENMQAEYDFNMLQHSSIMLLHNSYKNLKIRARDKEERHRYELLELIDWFYNKINLDKYDEDKYWLFNLHKTASIVLQHVNLSKANAQYINNSAKRSVSASALAFVYVTFELTLNNTTLYNLMRSVWNTILEVLPNQKKRRERKLKELISEIERLESKVVRYKLSLLQYL